MFSIIALGLTVGIQATPRVDVWKHNIRVTDLTTMLSHRGGKFTCDPIVADRRVHIFVRQGEPVEIARMTASAMGLKLSRRGSAWHFEKDPSYEAILGGHDRDIRENVRKATHRLVSHLRENPPRLAEKRSRFGSKWTAMPQGSRPRDLTALDESLWMSLGSHRLDVLWMLAKMTQAQEKDLLDGHAVIGAVPGRPGCITLPGKPDDYDRFRGSKQGYLILRPNQFPGQIDVGVLRLPIESTNPGAYSDHFGVLTSRDGSVYGFGQGWSRIGLWAEKWQNIDLLEFLYGRGGSPGTSPNHGSAAELIARATNIPTVVQASPRVVSGRGWETDQIGQLARNEKGWLLMKPALFWDVERAWNLERRIAQLGNPPVGDEKGSLDWLCRFYEAIPFHLRNYMFSSESMEMDRSGLGYFPTFSRFWKSLEPSKKALALGAGLSRTALSSEQKKLLTDVVCDLLIRGCAKGDSSGLVEPSRNSVLSIKSYPVWIFRHGTSAAYLRSKSQLLAELSRKPGAKTYRGVFFEIKLAAGSGYATADVSAYSPLKL